MPVSADEVHIGTVVVADERGEGHFSHSDERVVWGAGTHLEITSKGKNSVGVMKATDKGYSGRKVFRLGYSQISHRKGVWVTIRYRLDDPMGTITVKTEVDL
jgi:hypothetical protein